MTGIDPFVAEIGIAAFNFAPRGWALCNGQILSIAQNTALFSLLGTNYGGDGRSTFGLPNLQGGVALHFGQGPGLSQYDLGQSGGSQSITLLSTQMPAHTHGTATLAQPATTQPGITSSPENNVPANRALKYAPASNATMATTTLTLQPVGNNQPVSIMQPTLALTYCIALQGVFPQRP